MQPILVRIELGTLDMPTPNFADIVGEFVRKAREAGVEGVRPAMKIKEVLERPEAWGAPAGTEGYVAFLGMQTDRGEEAVAALSKITVTAPAVIDVKILTPAEVDEFQALVRRVTEIRKTLQQQALRDFAPNAGRHAAPANPSTGLRSTSAVTTAPGGPFVLALTTPEDASKTPVDIVNHLALKGGAWKRGTVTGP
jgi:hypothetical protein